MGRGWGGSLLSIAWGPPASFRSPAGSNLGNLMPVLAEAGH